MILRPYQRAALDALWPFLQERDDNPAIVLPTGAGKSPLMAAIAREAVTRWGGRVGVLAHVQELVSQNCDKLRQYWPDAPAGVYAAGLKSRDRFAKILFMQVQSVAKRAHELGAFDLLLVDEAHRIPLRGEGMYRQFIAEARRHSAHMRVVGLTATPYRLQGAAVPVCGPDNILNEIAYEVGVADLIRDGYLSPLIVKAGERPDLSGVHLRGGEYVEAELARAMTAPGLVQRTVADMLGRAQGRKAGIVFCVNVDHAAAVFAALQRAGEAAGLIHSGTEKDERARGIAAFQRGDLRWMVNINVLSEGFDAPHIDCVAMLRPTKSPGMYYQQVGRGFRLSPGKTDCLVLDYAGNTLEHGPIDAIKVRKRHDGTAEVGTAPSKQCPECDTVLAAGLAECPECGYQFPAREVKHGDKPVAANILSAPEPPPIVLHVGTVEYVEHVSKAGVPCLRVLYRCGLQRISEWVNLERGGYPRTKACAWWLRRDPACVQVPRTVAEALPLTGALLRPKTISARRTREGFWEVLSHEFDVHPGQKGSSHRALARSADDIGGGPHRHAVCGVSSL